MNKGEPPCLAYIPIFVVGGRAVQHGEDLWPQVQDALQATLSKPTFETWIRPARCRDFRGNRLNLEAPNSFACTWLRKHYLSQIQELASTLAQCPVTVSVEVAEEPASSPVAPGPAAEADRAPAT